MKSKSIYQIFVAVIVLLSTTVQSIAQIAINATGAAPTSTAMLDVSSTTKGLLIPRMNTTQRTSIANTQGLIVYDTTTQSFWYNDGTNWINMLTVANTSPWLVSGSNIYNNNTGNVGIGISNPAAKLVVNDNSSAGYMLFQTGATSGNGSFDGLFVGLSSSTAYVWNYENGPLILATNNSEGIRIAANGYVGIGGLTPTYPLDINGSTRITGNLVVTNTIYGSGGGTLTVGTTNVVGSLTINNKTVVRALDNTQLVYRGSVTFSGTSWGAGVSSTSGYFSFASGFTDVSVYVGNVNTSPVPTGNWEKMLIVPYEIDLVNNRCRFMLTNTSNAAINFSASWDVVLVGR